MLELDHRSVLPESEMSSVPVVVADVFLQQPTQMSPIQHDRVIEQNPGVRL